MFTGSSLILQFGFFVFLSTSNAENSGILIVPQLFRWNATNEIFVTTPESNGGTIDIFITIWSDYPLITVAKREFYAKISGTTIHVKFFVPPDAIKSYKLSVKTKWEDIASAEVKGGPDITRFHLQTDKGIYRPTEKVLLRALPITSSGQIYKGDIEYSLINPKGFSLMRQIQKAVDRFISLEFPIPLQLHYGEWKISARPTAGHDINPLTFSTSFGVDNYELPPFRVVATLIDKDEPAEYIIKILAVYAHGSFIRGQASVYCSCEDNKAFSKNFCPLGKVEDSKGPWSLSINVLKCSGYPENSVDIHVKVRDHGVGLTVETHLQLDLRVARFDIIPLRPGFTRTSEKILLLVVSKDGFITEGKRKVSVLAHYIGGTLDGRKENYEVEMGRILSIPVKNIDSEAIIIKAFQADNEFQSRPVSFVIPSLSLSPNINHGLIRPKKFPTDSVYKVGQTFKAEINSPTPSKFHYVVICNDNQINIGGTVRDDGIVLFEIHRYQSGACKLYVYNHNYPRMVDMLAFHITHTCLKAPLNISTNLVEAGNRDTVDIFIEDEPNTLGVIHIMDQRMYDIIQNLYPKPTKSYWSLNIFATDTENDHIHAFNILNKSDIMDSIRSSCQNAGKLLATQTKDCVIIQNSVSSVSQYCGLEMMKACENAIRPSSSNICDRNQKSCTNPNFKLATMQGTFRISVDDEPVNTDAVLLNSVKRMKTEISMIRELFPEIWYFNDFKIEANQRISVHLTAPDSATIWALNINLWKPNFLGVCSEPIKNITSKKDYIINVNAPKNIFANETVNIQVYVTVEKKLDKDEKLSLCIDDLSRGTCADIGLRGFLGKIDYDRILLTPNKTTVTREFHLRFYKEGETQITFKLMPERGRKHHCENPKVLDKVKVNIKVAKRTEIVENYQRLIIDPTKPNKMLMNTSLNGEFRTNDTENYDFISYGESRLVQSPLKLRTNIHINTQNKGEINGIIVELSKFSPRLDYAEILTDGNMKRSRQELRGKRSLNKYKSFLTDVLASLCNDVYNFKILSVQSDGENSKELNELQNDIGEMLSASLSFSDCHDGSTSCGFAESGPPHNSSERSFFLTTLATTLFCEAKVDEQIICKTLKHLFNELERNSMIDDKLLLLLSLTNKLDRNWFLKAMFNQLSIDCAVYHCIRNDEIWIKIRKEFLSKEKHGLDIRVNAALAYMAPKMIRDIMRIRLYSLITSDKLPYWQATANLYNSPSAFHLRSNKYLNIKEWKNDNLLVNALGHLSFMSRGVNPGLGFIELDLLADWINENIHNANSAVSIYFARRSLFEHQVRNVEASRIENATEVIIECGPSCTHKNIISTSSSIFFLPSSINNFTIVTEGQSKLRAGILVSYARDKRTADLWLGEQPVLITVSHENKINDEPPHLNQDVCIHIKTEAIEFLEVKHGFYSGFTPRGKDFLRLINSTLPEIRIEDSVHVSSHSVNFILNNLKSASTVCYSLNTYNSAHFFIEYNLSPITIVTRHPYYGIVGESVTVHLSQETGVIRYEDLVESVCWDGECVCAEMRCLINCKFCTSLSQDDLAKELCTEGYFGASVSIRSVRIVEKTHGAYFVLDTFVGHWKQLSNKSVIRPELMEVWLAKCVYCDEPKVGSNYYVGGHIVDVIVDKTAKFHYVLHGDDYFILAEQQCSYYFSQLIISSGCKEIYAEKKLTDIRKVLD